MDAIAAATHEDPYPYYAQLAARTGLFYDAALQLWVAAHPDTVGAVLAHPDCRVRPRLEPVPAAIAGGAAGQVFGELVRMDDGARYAAPRLALRRALAAQDDDAVRARTWAIAVALASVHDLRTPEGLTAWQFAVPVQTVASLLGFPEAQLTQVTAWVGDFVASLSPLSSAEQIQAAHVAALALLDSLRQLAQAAAAPGASRNLMVAVLNEATTAGWSEPDVVLANLLGLLSQTYEATAGLIGNTIVALIREPDSVQSAVVAEAGDGADGADGGNDRDCLAALVRYVIRFDPRVQNTRRFVAQATEIGGQRLEAGQVILLLAAAGRAVSASDMRLYSYGKGLHGCPGQMLSQAIAGVALEVLVASGPLQMMGWRYRPSVNARIPEWIATPSQENP